MDKDCFKPCIKAPLSAFMITVGNYILAFPEIGRHSPWKTRKLPFTKFTVMHMNWIVSFDTLTSRLQLQGCSPDLPMDKLKLGLI